MRHFVVLGFHGHSVHEPGSVLHVGTSQSAAQAACRADDGTHARKEMYECATAALRRTFDVVAQDDTKAKKKGK